MEKCKKCNTVLTEDLKKEIAVVGPDWCCKLKRHDEISSTPIQNKVAELFKKLKKENVC